MRADLRAVRKATLAAMLAAAMAVAGTSACGGDDGGDDREPPDPAALMTAAADEMAQVETVAVQMEADTAISGLPLRTVDGVITREGEAEGTAQIEEVGQRVDVEFVVVDGTLHYQLLGNWQQQPIGDSTRFYDPSLILDPDQGVADLLRSAEDPQIEGQEGDTWRVTAVFPAGSLGGLVPATPEGTRGTVWIGVDRPLLHRGEFPLPDEEQAAGTLRVELSDFNADVEITAPR